MRRKAPPDLTGSGPIPNRDALTAIETASDRKRATARLRRALVSAQPGPMTMQVVFAEVRLGDAQSARAMTVLSQRLEGPSRALVESCALIVRGDYATLGARIATEPLVGRYSAIAFCHAPRITLAAPTLFGRWIEQLRRGASVQGASAYRSFLGDVAEAAYRQIARGADPEGLLGEAGKSFFIDAIIAELGGTTDFLAARGMVWLLGVLAAADDAARSAIERARGRFRNTEFADDCRHILAGDPWPPPRSA